MASNFPGEQRSKKRVEKVTKRVKMNIQTADPANVVLGNRSGLLSIPCKNCFKISGKRFILDLLSNLLFHLER